METCSAHFPLVFYIQTDFTLVTEIHSILTIFYVVTIAYIHQKMKQNKIKLFTYRNINTYSAATIFVQQRTKKKWRKTKITHCQYPNQKLNMATNIVVCESFHFPNFIEHIPFIDSYARTHSIGILRDYVHFAKSTIRTQKSRMTEYEH